MSIEVGSILEGRVTGITNFGAFVDLGNGQTGLVHISEVADQYVEDINQFLKMNDIVKVRVINVQDGKIGLSIRRVTNDRPRRSGGNRVNKSFEMKLKRFLRDSEERQASLKRSLDAKRGGRGSRHDF
ncbi:MAG TPA: S1 RNA-binding domain-containing protein [Limnochorda sp.]